MQRSVRGVCWRPLGVRRKVGLPWVVYPRVVGRGGVAQPGISASIPSNSDFPQKHLKPC